MEGGVILVFSLWVFLQPLHWPFSVLVRISILFVDLIGLKTVMKASK